jgi:hypothetical protein
MDLQYLERLHGYTRPTCASDFLNTKLRKVQSGLFYGEIC